MSRQNPHTELKNPSKMFAQWKDPGLFVYYDKELQKNVELPGNFTFVVLAEFSTIKGWNDPSSSGIYSNEIRNLTTEKLTVKAFKGGLIAEGTYGTICDTIKAAGAKFCSSVYVAYKDDEGFKIGNIQFAGSSLGSWFDFKKDHKSELYTKGVQLVGKHEAKKGATKYYTPAFKIIEISESTDNIAGDLQEELKAYHTEYFKDLEVEKGLDIAKEEVEKEFSQEIKEATKEASHDEDKSFAPDNFDSLPF